MPAIVVVVLLPPPVPQAAPALTIKPLAPVCRQLPEAILVMAIRVEVTFVAQKFVVEAFVEVTFDTKNSVPVPFVKVRLVVVTPVKLGEDRSEERRVGK